MGIVMILSEKDKYMLIIDLLNNGGWIFLNTILNLLHNPLN